MQVFTEPAKLSRHVISHYFQNEKELKVMIKMARDDYRSHMYEKSGYLWGEIAAIVVWGHFYPPPQMDVSDLMQ